MDLSHDPDEIIAMLDDLQQAYETVEASDDADAMARMDADMKATTLQSIRRDVDRFGGG